MQELREQRSQSGPVVTIGKHTGVKMGNHLVRKRDLGLRPLAGAQGHVARRDLRVGALARGHDLELQQIYACSRDVRVVQLLCCDPQPTRRLRSASASNFLPWRSRHF